MNITSDALLCMGCNAPLNLDEHDDPCPFCDSTNRTWTCGPERMLELQTELQEHRNDRLFPGRNRASRLQGRARLLAGIAERVETDGILNETDDGSAVLVDGLLFRGLLAAAKLPIEHLESGNL